MPGGRPRTPTAKLKLHGKFREDRHGDRNGEPSMVGAPIKPDDLSDWAASHWDAVVPELASTNVAKRIDTDALAVMCEWWAEWKKLQNGEAEMTGHKRIIQMAVCNKQWRELARNFGLTPADRAKLGVGGGESDDPASEFIA